MSHFEKESIDQNLPEAENNIWHAHPVWFLEGNPVVCYSKLKACIRLLFWLKANCIVAQKLRRAILKT